MNFDGTDRDISKSHVQYDFFWAHAFKHVILSKVAMKGSSRILAAKKASPLKKKGL